MTQEDKELLLKDLCVRLPYGVVADCVGEYVKIKYVDPYSGMLYISRYTRTKWETVEVIKPYLRPLFSMTEEEKKELLNLLFDKEAKYFYIDEEGFIDGKISDLMKEGLNYPSFCPINIELYTDFLLSHHFDYRGLIEKGLALEAPEGMYEY